MRMVEIEVGADYRVEYLGFRVVTVVQVAVPRLVSRKDGVRVRFHEDVSSTALPYVSHEKGAEGVISQRCFLEKVK
jgi:hypothetical protein